MLAAVVLAAGAAERFGSPKQRLLLPGVLARVRVAASIDRIVVVAGAYALDVDADTVRCLDW
jgi:CTP:molybdopterin cytidylyltransferase MocA